MRRILALVLFSAFCAGAQVNGSLPTPVSGGGGSTALVQHKVVVQGTTPISATFSSAVTAGNTIIVLATVPTNSGTTITATDNDSNSYASSTAFTTTLDGVPYKLVSFCVTNPTLTINPPTISINAGSANHSVGDIREYSGLTCTIDQQIASTTPTSTVNAVTQNITTTQTDLLVIAFYDINTLYSSVGSGWLNSDNNVGGTVGAIFGDQPNMPAGTYNGAATLTGADAFWFGIIIAYVR